MENIDDEWGICKKNDIENNVFVIYNSGRYFYIDNEDVEKKIKSIIFEKFSIINENNLITCFHFNNLYYIFLNSENETDSEILRSELMKYEKVNSYRISILIGNKEYLRVSI